MWDFDNLPKNKISELRKILSGVKISKPVDKYAEIDITERVEILEKVYTVLSRDENPEPQKSAENGINQRIQDYITRIKSEKEKPRYFDKYSEREL